MTREEVRDIATIAGREAADQVIERHEKACPVVRKVVREEIAVHVSACPVSQKMEIKVLRLLLYLTASGAIGGGVVAVANKLLGTDSAKAVVTGMLDAVARAIGA